MRPGRPAGLVALLVLATAVVSAQVPMPDPKTMSGVPLPSGDLPNGTVSARVIRGQLGNNIAGQTVELVGDGASRTATTDDSGRATFAGLPAGARVQVRAAIGGEVLASQEFSVPGQGGIRVMLVATPLEPIAPATSPDAPPQPGAIALGPDSRLVIELGESALSVFVLLSAVNTARTPVTLPAPLVIDLPAGARGASVLEGSTSYATAAGTRVTAAGPFPPGTAPIEFAYTLPYSGARARLEQTLPLALPQVSVIAQSVAEMRLTSPQISAHEHRASQGQDFIVAQGPALGAGRPLSIELTGLPHRSRTARNIAVALAVAILAIGLLGTLGRPAPVEHTNHGRLMARRDSLFADLVRVEEQRRDRRVDEARYGERRQELMRKLERVYAELDRLGLAAAAVEAEPSSARPARRSA
jgi:hypothetical protein